MHLEGLNNIAKSKSKILTLKKISKYESKKSGVKASVFLDKSTNTKIKVVKLGKDNIIRKTLKADEFVFHNMQNNNLRRLALFDTKGKMICSGYGFSDKIIETLSHPYKRFAEFRRLFSKFLKK